MPVRPPEWGLELWSDDGGEPSASAWLDIRKEAGHPSKTARRIRTVLRGAGFGAMLRVVVGPEDGSQMIAAMERIVVTVTWAVAFTASLGIVIATALPAWAVIAILGLEVAGFAITLLMTRWKHRGRFGSADT